MKVIRKLAIALALVVLVAFLAVLVVGTLLPAEPSFMNEIDIDAPAETVWRVINDRERYTEWQTQLDRVEIIDEKNWVEYAKSAPEPLRFSLAEDARPKSMEFGYSMGDAMHGHWRGEVEPTANGVRLKTTDSYKADGLMMKILMGTFFDLDGFAKDWNNKLKHRVENLDR